VFAAVGRVAARRGPDLAGRGLVAAIGLVVLYHPALVVAGAAGAAVAVLLAVGVFRCRTARERKADEAVVAAEAGAASPAGP
jgi:hypothetical protein